MDSQQNNPKSNRKLQNYRRAKGGIEEIEKVEKRKLGFFAITPTGDVMPCGRFCDNSLKQYSYGNLHSESLEQILSKVKESAVYKRYIHIENSSCSKCEFFEICHGGCLHDGFLKSGDFESKTFLCSSYKRIFAHISSKLKTNQIQ